MRVIHVLSAIVVASLATACGHKDSSSGSTNEDPIGGDSQVASEASTQSEHFGNDLFANVDPSKDATTNGAAIEASSGAKLWPPGCVTRKRDASCNAQSCVVHVTFDDCTGPFGLVHIQGGDDITITQNGGGGLTASLASVSLTANGRPVSHTATADVVLDANGGRTIHWQGHWARTRDDGVDVDHTSDLTIVADPVARCRTSNGTTKTVTSKREIDGTVTSYEACWGNVGGFVEEYCPSGSLSYSSNGKTASIVFDGSAHAEITGPRGNSVEWPLVCPAKPLRALSVVVTLGAMASKRTSAAEADAGVLDGRAAGEDERFDRLFRPTSLDEYIGQEREKENLRVFVEAARRRGEPLDHVLLCGPPGLGKTTLAHILAREMGVQLHLTSGPAVEHKGALAGLLTKLEKNDVLFIDEIHRLAPAVEESLYPAIEDFQIEIVTGDGPYATTIQLPLKPFTLIGATTRTGLLTAPLISRFGHLMRLDYYGVDDLTKIVLRSACLLGVPIDDAGARTIASRSRGTPRVANRLLRRVRDFAEVKGNGKIDTAIALHACERLEVDAAGLNDLDRRFLAVLIDTYEGGPTGVETLAASLSEPRDTLEDVVEPYLLQQGFLARTPRGRMATKKAFEHLGKKLVRPQPAQAGLFDDQEK